MTTIVVTDANIDSIPNKAGTHVTHCCGKHGCKYGDSDCAVKTGEYTQMYACSYCQSVETIQGKITALTKELQWTLLLAERGIIVTGDGEDW